VEPFEKLEPRVLKLATERVWPGSKAGDITVRKIAAGGFNRVIGLGRKEEEVILRLPHCNDVDINAEVSILDFVRRHTTIPLPEVVSVDDKTDNDLDSKYCIQRLLPSGTVVSLYPGLTHSQKCQAARELGNVMNQMLAVKSNIAGRISGQPLDNPSTSTNTFLSKIHSWINRRISLKWILGEDIITLRQSHVPRSLFHIEPLLPRFNGLTPEEADRRYKGAGFGTAYSDPVAVRPYQAKAPQESTLDLLTALCKINKTNSILSVPVREGMPHLMDRFILMAQQLADQGRLNDRSYSLCHLDFHPRNIMINPGAREIISGIIDWDSALFLPTFMACEPPMWLWAWDDEDDEDERHANDMPSTREDQEIKAIFEEAAGETYLKFAYDPSYRLGRQLVKYIIEDVRCDPAPEIVGQILDEWDALCSQRKGRQKK
jgi:aminoglycoside phosphotransferase (APT) family kinase protein